MKDSDAFGDEVNVTPESMRTFAEALRAIAKRHEDVADWMEKDGITGIRSKNLRTAALSLVPLAKFLGAVVSAYCDNQGAKGLEQLAGGVALLNKYLKRKSAELLEQEKKKPRKAIAEGSTIAKESVTAGKKLLKTNPPKEKPQR